MEWINRGGVLVRRINSERIAEDPRLKYFLTHEMNEIEWQQAFIWTPQPVVSPDATPIASAAEAAAPPEAVHWTDKVVQHLHHTPADASIVAQKDVLMQISPRLAALSVPCLTLFADTFIPASAPSSSSSVKAEGRVIQLLHDEIRERFPADVGIFDVGLMEKMKATHSHDVFDLSFGGGRISALKCSAGDLPTMNDLFIGCSTIASWLALKPDNATVLLAPSHARQAVFLACLMMYCSDPTEDTQDESPHQKGMQMLEWYMNLVSESTSNTSRVKSGGNTLYASDGPVPRHAARLVSDFARLLEKRDALLADAANQRSSIAGLVGIPQMDPIYVEKITLLQSKNDPESRQLRGGYRPYFVLHDAQGLVLYSSLIHGVHNALLSDGPHDYLVNRRVPPGDIVLKMYHVPKGVRGEVIFACRLHTSLLLDSESASHITLRLQDGDFDSVSSRLPPPVDFAVQLSYRRAEVEEKPPQAVAPPIDDAVFESDLEKLITLFPSLPKTVLVRCRRLARGSTDPLTSAVNALLHSSDECHENRDDFCIESFCYENEDMHINTSLGTTKKLLRIELRSDLPMVLGDRHANTRIVFVVVKQDKIERLDESQVIGPLPQVVCRALTDLGVRTSRSASSQQEDAQYARELLQGSMSRPREAAPTPSLPPPVRQQRPREDETFIESALQSLFSVAAGGWELVSRPPIPLHVRRQQQSQQRQPTGGATATMIEQLPIYLYHSNEDDDKSKEEEECLICQYVYETGDRLRTLPCFHMYHSDCIDPWLVKNGTCPVCLRHIVQ